MRAKKELSVRWIVPSSTSLMLRSLALTGLNLQGSIPNSIYQLADLM